MYRIPGSTFNMELFICTGGSKYFSQIIDHLKKVVLICGIQNLICQIIYFIECASQGYNARKVISEVYASFVLQVYCLWAVM